VFGIFSQKYTIVDNALGRAVATFKCSEDAAGKKGSGHLDRNPREVLINIHVAAPGILLGWGKAAFWFAFSLHGKAQKTAQDNSDKSI
jgi:hypothetical protein